MSTKSRQTTLWLGLVLISCVLGYRAAGEIGGTISAIGFEVIPAGTTLVGDSILLEGEVVTSGNISSGGSIEAAGTICGAAGCVGSPSQSRTAYYLTQSVHQGSAALSACESRFHMASLWEILEISNLRYAIEVGDAATQDDSGQGPPTGLGGWIRTGWFSNPGPIPGNANCELWTSSQATRSGTVVKLQETWDMSFEVDWLGPWNPASIQCDLMLRVWCVED